MTEATATLTALNEQLATLIANKGGEFTADQLQELVNQCRLAVRNVSTIVTTSHWWGNK